MFRQTLAFLLTCWMSLVTSNALELPPPSAEIPSDCLRPNTALPGLDLHEIAMCPTPEDCARYCLAEPKCNMFTYDMQKTCHLKETHRAVLEKPGYFSGTKKHCGDTSAPELYHMPASCLQPNTALPGAEIKIISRCSSASECAEWCMVEPRCSGFTYDIYHNCRIKETYRAIIEKSNYISGLRQNCMAEPPTPQTTANEPTPTPTTTAEPTPPPTTTAEPTPPPTTTAEPTTPSTTTAEPTPLSTTTAEPTPPPTTTTEPTPPPTTTAEPTPPPTTTAEPTPPPTTTAEPTPPPTTTVQPTPPPTTTAEPTPPPTTTAEPTPPSTTTAEPTPPPTTTAEPTPPPTTTAEPTPPPTTTAQPTPPSTTPAEPTPPPTTTAESTPPPTTTVEPTPPPTTTAEPTPPPTTTAEPTPPPTTTAELTLPTTTTAEPTPPPTTTAATTLPPTTTAPPRCNWHTSADISAQCPPSTFLKGVQFDEGETRVLCCNLDLNHEQKAASYQVSDAHGKFLICDGNAFGTGVCSDPANTGACGQADSGLNCGDISSKSSGAIVKLKSWRCTWFYAGFGEPLVCDRNPGMEIVNRFCVSEPGEQQCGGTVKHFTGVKCCEHW